MKPRFQVRMHSGAFVGRVVSTNAGGRGVYTLADSEAGIELRIYRTATNTPIFRSARTFAQYVRRNFPEGSVKF